MFDWINDIAGWIGNLIPDWDLLLPTEGGIKFSFGGKIIELEPGHIYWWWPAVSSIITLDTRRQTLSFNQRLTTKDEVEVSLNTVIVFVVDDVIKALVDTNDFLDTIEEVAQKLVVQPVMSRTFEEIRRDVAESNDMRNELTRGARNILSPYGVKVLDSYMSDFTKTTVITHDGSGLAVNYEENE